MMSVEEMREYERKTVDARIEGELEEIEAEIKAAIHRGKREITLNKWYSKAAVERLISLGYTVKEESSQREGNWTVIRW